MTQTTDHTGTTHFRELGEAAAGGPEQLDALLSWASRTLSPADREHFNRGLEHAATVAKTIHDLQSIAEADAKRRGPAPASATGNAPDANRIRRQTGAIGAQVGARPRIAADPPLQGRNATG